MYTFDELTKKILSLKAQKVIANYWNEIENIFTLYVKKNYVKSKLFLNWDEIKVQGKGMKLATIYVFLYEAGILPFHMTIDQYNDICSKTLVTMSEKLQYFYQDKKIKILLKRPANNTDSASLKIDGDPHALIHDFVLILSKIGVEIIKLHFDSKMEASLMLEKFFRDNLFLRTNEEIKNNQLVFEPKTKFLGYLQKLHPQLMDLEDESDKKDHKTTNDIIDEFESISKTQEEITPFSVVLQSFKTHFAMQKLCEFSTFKTYKDDTQNETNTSNRLNPKANPIEALIIGVNIPVSKQRTESKKANIKSNKPEKPIPYEKKPEVEPAKSFTHNLNFYRALIKDEPYKDFRDRNIDPVDIELELIYSNITPPNFENNTDAFELFNCFMAGCKAGKFNMASTALARLTNIIEENFKDRVDLTNLSFFIKGMMFEHMGMYELAAHSFYKCLKNYEKLLNKNAEITDRADVPFLRHGLCSL